MTKRNLRFFACVAFAAVSAGTSLAAQDFGDDFEDGDLGVNNGANGTGFESGTHLIASVAEANDAAEFSATDNTSGAWIIGKDTLDPDGFSTTWSFNNWVDPGGRLCVGLAKDPAASYSPGFLIDTTRGTDQIRVALRGTTRGDRLEIQHVFNNTETTLTQVASLSSRVDSSTSFEISFSVTATGYEATIDQGGSTVVGPVTGTWAAGGVTLTDVEDTNGEMRVSANLQGTFQASTASLDKIGLCGIAWKFNSPAGAGGETVNFTATCDTSEVGNKALVFISLGNGSPSIKVPLSGGKRLFLDFDSILIFWIGLPSPVRQVTLNNCSGESTVPVAIPASAPVGVSVYFAGHSIDGLGNVPSVTSTKSFVTQ